MKKKLIAALAASVMFLFAIPAHADSIVHLWSCNFNDGKTGEELAAVSSAWLAAAKTMEGGDSFKVYLEFPLVAGTGDVDFTFVVVVDNIANWGVFMNGYPDSPADQADIAWDEVATCSANALWASVEVK